jgi:RNA polymerase sigma-70 factor, ECF subfamily
LDLLSDEQLVALTQGGNLEAFNRLIARRGTELYRLLLRNLRNRDDALDLCQEALVRAYQQIGTKREGARFKTWLYQIALNLCRDHFRSARSRQRTRVRVQTDLEGAAELMQRTQGEGPDRGALRADAMGHLGEILEKLPEEQSTAILLREYQGFTSGEIAEITGVPEATVRTRIFYGLKAIRKIAAERGVLDSLEV